jgi:hypothetical protein
MMNDEQREAVDHLFWVFEYGAGYWFRAERTCDDPERHGDRFDRCTACRWDGVEAERDGASHRVTFLTLLEGVKRMATEDHRWHNAGWPAIAKNTILALNGTEFSVDDDGWEDSDTDWGDAVGQLGLFGDLLYG